MRAAIPLAAFLFITTAAAAQSSPPYQGQPGPGPYDAAQGAPPMDQQGGPSPGSAPYSGAPQGGHGMKAMEKFQAANTTHDGKLTLQQAQAANLHPIIRNFAAIDREHKGYVTVQDIREWRQAAAPRCGSSRRPNHPRLRHHHPHNSIRDLSTTSAKPAEGYLSRPD